MLASTEEVFAQLAREGKCGPATTDSPVWSALGPLKPKKAIPMQTVLDDLRSLDGK